MIKSYVLGLTAALTLTIASVANANPSVFGKWTHVIDQEELSYTLNLDIQQTQSSLSVVCVGENRAATALVTVPTEVTETKFILKGAASDDQSIEGLECAVDVVPMEFEYKFDGADTLLLTAEGQTIPFTRVNFTHVK